MTGFNHVGLVSAASVILYPRGVPARLKIPNSHVSRVDATLRARDGGQRDLRLLHVPGLRLDGETLERGLRRHDPANGFLNSVTFSLISGD